MIYPRLALIVFTAAWVVMARAAAPADWPQWRGPNGAGVAEGVFKDRWTPDSVAWKTAIPGRGHSSAVVANGRIYVTTAVEGEPLPGHKAPVHLGFDLKPGYVNPDSCCIDRKYALKVLALDARTGAVLWERTAFDGAMYDDRHRKNTYASSTVATDGELLYAYFESAGLYAYDTSGTLKWKTDFGGLAKAGMGPGMSPLIYGDLLIVQNDLEMGEGSHIIALDRRTGRHLWKTARSHRRSWATPIVVDANGRKELIASGAESVIAYDPLTGAELWRTEGVRSHPIPSVVAGHGLVFATAGSGAKVALAIRPGDVDPAARVAWKYNKGTAYVASPILYGNYLYLLSDAGLMTCLDARTGEVKYEGGRPPVPATFRASPVAFDGKLLITSEDGDTFVIRAGPAHEVLTTNSVGEPVWASPALASGTIYIRGERHLFAIR
jgi:outer membrane protein assembly factor BamB